MMNVMAEFTEGKIFFTLYSVYTTCTSVLSVNSAGTRNVCFYRVLQLNCTIFMWDEGLRHCMFFFMFYCRGNGGGGCNELQPDRPFGT